MIELKAISSGEIYNIIEYEGSCITDDLYYPKSEADKVIAELENRIDEGDNEFDFANRQNERLLKIVRHQKYKRCLAMAQEWRNYAAFCGKQSSCHNHRGFGKTAEKYTWKECHAWKCVNRYKELAGEFKEAK